MERGSLVGFFINKSAYGAIGTGDRIPVEDINGYGKKVSEIKSMSYCFNKTRSHGLKVSVPAC